MGHSFLHLFCSVNSLKIFVQAIFQEGRGVIILFLVGTFGPVKAFDFGDESAIFVFFLF